MHNLVNTFYDRFLTITYFKLVPFAIHEVAISIDNVDQVLAYILRICCITFAYPLKVSSSEAMELYFYF